MIRKPKRISVRFSEYEMNEMKELMRLSHSWDKTSFIRNAVSFYRRHLYAELERQKSLATAAEAAPREKAPKLTPNKRKPKAIAG